MNSSLARTAPGSGANWTLAAEGRFQTAAMQVLSNCVTEIARRRELKADSLILAGSMSRGEGIAFDEGGKVRFLSDMEFLVATSDTSRIAARRKALKEAAEAAQAKSRKESVECKVEFTFAFSVYFRTVRPSIFRHDLARHGRTVWGDPAPLNAVAACGPSEIPMFDAFNLLCNRLVEQLDLRTRLTGLSGEAPSPVEARYALLKGSTDLATSLLALLGRHEPLLSRRREALAGLDEKILAALPEKTIAKMRDGAAARGDGESLARWLSAPGNPDGEWRALVAAQLDVAKIELEILRGAGRGDMAALLMWLSESGRMSEAARERGKIILRALRAGRLGDALKLRLTGGLPRRMLYAWAMTLAANLSGQDEAWLGQNRTPSFSPFPARKASDGVEAARLVSLWKRYFRNS